MLLVCSCMLMVCRTWYVVGFFFQAEDGIRDGHVTGVQTCALPIYAAGIVARQVRGEFLIDDSGLFVDALGGFPGVYSSYVYRTIGPGGVLALMKREARRSARFETVFLLGRRGRPPRIFRGACEGSIARAPPGRGGFGFAPIFVPRGSRRTFGEMSLAEKNAV